jgi:hypothetical protein
VNGTPLSWALAAEAIGAFALTRPVAGTSLGALAYQFVRGEQTRPAELVAETIASKEEPA